MGTPSGEHQREQTHAEISNLLTNLDDRRLRSLLADSPATKRAWGSTHSIAVGDHPVFVKRVPLTGIEVDAGTSTRNHFNLPPIYHYGVGSAGFGAFRELAIHQATTELVLSGAASGFPLLYHYRVMERADPPSPYFMDIDQYTTWWNNDPAIRAYIEARQASRHELWLFAERLPIVVHDWYPANQDRSQEVVTELCDAARVLNERGIIHFDAHFGNALTDGQHFYFADFGLALSDDFELDDKERQFLDRHRHYDQGLIIWGLGYLLPSRYRALEAAALTQATSILNIPQDATDHDVLVAIIDHADQLAEPGLLDLRVDHVVALRRYGDVIVYVDRFIQEIRRPAKDARFEDDQLLDLLTSARAR